MSSYSEEFKASSGITSNAESGLELGLSGWKVQAQSAVKEFQSVILKVQLNFYRDYDAFVKVFCILIHFNLI